MWWQVLPPIGIIGVMVSISAVGMGFSHYIFTGKPTDRDYTEGTYIGSTQKLAYQRDTYKFGHEWISRGLDYLKDDD